MTPNPVQSYHYRLLGSPIPGECVEGVWAKGDKICSVGFHRLDRVKVKRGNYVVGHISMEQVNAIRSAAATSFGARIGSQ